MAEAREKFEITHLSKAARVPRAAFLRMKDAALGYDYSLSLVFIDAKKMQTLNRERRNKDYPTDILSFTLDKNAGEIFICPTAARAKAKEFGRTYPNYLAFIFIHGLIHLKGLTIALQWRDMRKNYERNLKFNDLLFAIRSGQNLFLGEQLLVNSSSC